MPRGHLAPCLLCDQTSGQCRQQGGVGPGVPEADIILYISSKTSSLCEESATLSHAGHCSQVSGHYLITDQCDTRVQDPNTDRPIAGHVNICPDNVDSIKELTENLKHEILHILGFSVKLFAFFRTRKGNPRTRRNKLGKPPLHSKYFLHVADNTTVARVVRDNWLVSGGSLSRPVHMLVTPRVRREARSHFRCRELEGGELEDQGDLGTSLTHWEKRVFGDEAMTGNHQELEIRGQVFRERKLISRQDFFVLRSDIVISVLG